MTRSVLLGQGLVDGCRAASRVNPGPSTAYRRQPARSVSAKMTPRPTEGFAAWMQWLDGVTRCAVGDDGRRVSGDGWWRHPMARGCRSVRLHPCTHRIAPGAPRGRRAHATRPSPRPKRDRWAASIASETQNSGAGRTKVAPSASMARPGRRFRAAGARPAATGTRLTSPARPIGARRWDSTRAMRRRACAGASAPRACRRRLPLRPFRPAAP
jgi:hypothetical protein